jgi:hypothetical protein
MNTSVTHKSTECARDRDLYKLVSCRKFVNEILFCNIYKTLYLTLGHHALGVILCLCLNLFWVINSWIVFAKPKKLKKLGARYFCLWRSGSLAHPVVSAHHPGFLVSWSQGCGFESRLIQYTRSKWGDSSVRIDSGSIWK